MSVSGRLLPSMLTGYGNPHKSYLAVLVRFSLEPLLGSITAGDLTSTVRMLRVTLRLSKTLVAFAVA